MKILITHAYAKNNKGDAAILSVQLSQLRKAFPNAYLSISTIENVQNNKTFEGTRMISSFLSLSIYKKSNKFLKLIESFRILLTTTVWTYMYMLTNKKIKYLIDRDSEKILKEFIEADLIVPIGGGYLRAKNTLADSLNLILLLHPIFLSVLLKKPIILYSQSLGPFSNKLQILIARFVLNKVNLIIVRENTSINILRKINICKDILIRSVDAGFLFNSSIENDFKALSDLSKDNSITVGITARKWLNENDQDSYESEMANFINYITKKGNINVILIPQVTASNLEDDDREVGRRIIKKLNSKTNITFINKNLTHHEIKAIYSNLDYIVGTRFHSVIFSLTSFVPAIAIEYEHKTGGIMNDLGLSEWVIKMEDVNADILIEKFERLTKLRKIYLDILKKNLPPYINEAKNTINYVVQAYNRHENLKKGFNYEKN